MIGPIKVRRFDQPIAVSLEALVPPDNFYRHVDKSLDLSFVRELVRDTYALMGRNSIDPIVFFKLPTFSLPPERQAGKHAPSFFLYYRGFVSKVRFLPVLANKPGFQSWAPK